MTRWMALIFMLIFGLSGCVVSKGKYDAALADMESAKVDVEKGRMHQEALEEQVRNLKGLNEKISTDLDVMTAEVQRIKEGRKNEHTLLETRERELAQEKAELSSKLRVLMKQYHQARIRNKVLVKDVLRYKKELKDLQPSTMKEAMGGKQASMPAISQGKTSMKKTPKAMIPKAAMTPEVAKSSKPSIQKKAALPVMAKVEALRVNINKASVSDLVLTLGLSRDLAEEVVSNRPYRLRGELVAKNVIPKATFDEIKGRITASP